MKDILKSVLMASWKWAAIESYLGFFHTINRQITCTTLINDWEIRGIGPLGMNRT